MPDIVKLGESIEGDSVSGHCREILRYRGVSYSKDRRTIFSFSAKGDVKSKIETQISKNVKRLSPNAHTSIDDELICEKASIETIKNKYSNNVGANVSATHGANCWKFQCQTAVKIISCHPSLINGLRKRLITKAIV